LIREESQMGSLFFIRVAFTGMGREFCAGYRE